MKKDFKTNHWKNYLPIPVCEQFPQYKEFYEKAWDLARAHVCALEYLERGGKKKYSAFNVGTGKGTSVKEIIEAIKKTTGIKFKEKIEGRRPGDPPMLIGNAELIGRVMGWQSEKSLEDIISSAWQAWQAGPKRIDVENWKERS